MCALFADGRAAFLICDAVVEDLPHEPTEPMRDRADRLGMAEAWDERTSVPSPGRAEVLTLFAG